MRFQITERQVVSYSWEVEAESASEALRTAEDGVPENARSELLSSNVEVATTP